MSRVVTRDDRIRESYRDTSQALTRREIERRMTHSCTLPAPSRNSEMRSLHAMTQKAPVRASLLSLVLILLFASSASAEWKEKVLYSFQGSPDAATPQGGVVFDKRGNLYGAALGGPQYSQGTVFQLVPPAKKGDPWTESVLYVFQGKPANDGQVPTGGLVIDGVGNLYGVTGYGGTGSCILLGISVGCGTVYEISPPEKEGGLWRETILYSFQSGKDGYFPTGNLVFDNAG